MPAEEEYLTRINNVLNYIHKNLEKELSLQKLAKVACFSQFHFHRIFKSCVGENAYAFIKRVRLEKSAGLLMNNLDSTIAEIAFTSGFSSSSHYAYAFKEHFGVTPKEFQKMGSIWPEKRPNNFSSENMCVLAKLAELNGENHDNDDGQVAQMSVEIKNLPSFHVVYVRHIGKYERCDKAWKAVTRWAGFRKLLNPDTCYIGIIYDNPDVTPPGKCRYDACVTVPTEVKASGKVALAEIPSGMFAVHRVKDIPGNFGEAFEVLFRQWLPRSGHQADDRPLLLFHHNHPKDDPQGHVVADLCVPVKPL